MRDAGKRGIPHIIDLGFGSLQNVDADSQGEYEGAQHYDIVPSVYLVLKAYQMYIPPLLSIADSLCSAHSR